MKTLGLAQILGGVVEGDGNINITGVSSMDLAKAGDLTFAVDEERLALAERSAASCILTGMGVRKSAKTLICVKNPKLAFLMVYNILNKPETRPAFRHPTAAIALSARLGKDVWVGPGVSIEDGVSISDNVIIEANSVIKKGCRIGTFCRIYPNVTLYEYVELKKNVILHAGVVVGADGFGYVREKDKIYKFPQLGKVIIEDDVEVGANTAIDRGSLSVTVIGAGTKIDNFCQIAHNVKVGKNVLMAAHCGIAGSVVIKDNVTIGGQVGIADNVTIEEGVVVGAQSGIMNNIDKGAIIWGTPAKPIMQTKRQMVALTWLSKNIARVKKLISK